MRRRRLFMILAVVVMVMGVMAPAGAAKGGVTAEQLGASPAWDCDTAGPHAWMHCGNVKNGNGKATQVRVFGPADLSDGYTVGDPFLGTEILLDASVYHGQPCATDGGGLYHDLRGPDGEDPPGTGPFACHHFNTP